jgi:hypothetical protein
MPSDTHEEALDIDAQLIYTCDEEVTFSPNEHENPDARIKDKLAHTEAYSNSHKHDTPSTPPLQGENTGSPQKNVYTKNTEPLC